MGLTVKVSTLEELCDLMCDNAVSEKMTEEEAKAIIRNDPAGNILNRLEAIEVAKKCLGEDCTMEDIWGWIKSSENRKNSQKQGFVHI